MTRVSRRAASRATRGSIAPSSPPPASTAASIRTATTLRAPSRRGQAVSDAGSAMDVEEEGETEQQRSVMEKKLQDKVLVKDDNYIVTERKGLPVEVQQAISLAGQSISQKFTHLLFRSPSYSRLYRSLYTASESCTGPKHWFRPPRDERILFGLELVSSKTALSLPSLIVQVADHSVPIGLTLSYYLRLPPSIPLASPFDRQSLFTSLFRISRPFSLLQLLQLSPSTRTRTSRTLSHWSAPIMGIRFPLPLRRRTLQIDFAPSPRIRNDPLSSALVAHFLPRQYLKLSNLRRHDQFNFRSN